MISVTQILGIINQDFGPDPDRVEAAADRGKRVHSACTAYALGLYPSLDSDTEGYFRSFKNWFDEMVREVILEPEMELVDSKWGFCGHPDFPWLRLKNGKNVLVDLKTPVQHRRIWDIQVGGGYWHLVRIHTGLTIIEPGCLLLDPDGGTARMQWVKNPEECFSVFCGILKAKRFLNGDR